MKTEKNSILFYGHLTLTQIMVLDKNKKAPERGAGGVVFCPCFYAYNFSVSCFFFLIYGYVMLWLLLLLCCLCCLWRLVSWLAGLVVMYILSILCILTPTLYKA